MKTVGEIERRYCGGVRLARDKRRRVLQSEPTEVISIASSDHSERTRSDTLLLKCPLDETQRQKAGSAPGWRAAMRTILRDSRKEGLRSITFVDDIDERAEAAWEPARFLMHGKIGRLVSAR
eukprot:1833305-Rhodomonas_salina.1